MSGVVRKAMRERGGHAGAALSATERVFLDAVKITRSSLGSVADAQGWYLRRLVPLMMFGCLALAVHARTVGDLAFAALAELEDGLSGDPAGGDGLAHTAVAQSFMAPANAHVRVAVGAAAAGTLVVGRLMWRLLLRADRDPSAVLVASCVAIVPVYAWACALRLLLPGPAFVLHRQVLEAAKECYEAVSLESVHGAGRDRANGY